MKNHFTRLLALVLSAVMLFGMMPVFTVSAAETEAEPESTTKTVRVIQEVEDGVVRYTTETVEETADDDATTISGKGPDPVFSITENSATNYDFTTFEDLKELAAGTYTDWVYVHYEGTEALVISENLSLPAKMQLYSYNAEVIIPAGVTFSTNAYFSAQSLTVEGTMYSSSVYITGSLKITGALYTSSDITVNADEEVIGQDKITYSDDWISFTRYGYSVNDLAQLQEMISLANASTDSHERFNADVHGAIEITESVTIPGNLRLDFRYDVSVAAGATLTLEDSITYVSAYLYAPMTVSGTLVNNRNLTVAYGSGGLLTLEEGGSYSGTGRLSVYGSGLTDVQTALPGMNLDDFEIDHFSTSNWSLRYVANLTKLGTPTELQWGYETEWHWDSETETSNTTLVEGNPGQISWKTALPDQNHVSLEFYKVDGDTEEYAFGGGWNFGSDSHVDYRAAEDFLLHSPESGDYYFTVTSQGDYTQYRDSDTAKSGIYSYVKPDAQLDTCTNLTWDFPEMSWEAPANSDNIGFYYVEYYFSPTADGEPIFRGGSFGFSSTRDSLWDEFLQDNGVGYYYFKVQAISGNIEEICNSEWSELSPAYNLTELVLNVEDKLSNIVSDSSLTTEEKVDAVQDLDNEDLKYAMLTDDTVVDQIASLEEENGGGAAVEVTNEAFDFDASQISVVGASLNTTTDSADGVTLVVDKPEEEHVIPEAYNNAVAVSFSMDLDNVADTENLEVPVRITLPVPANINPGFLVILHYHVDGSYEEIWPHLSMEGGQYYATFVLTSFSDFMMVESYPFMRMAGNDRYETAFLAADLLLEVQGKSKFSNIVVACGTDFADALSGSYLANQKNAPVLLVRNNKKTISAVKEYIQTNLKSGGTVYLLGGTNAVPKAMETGLENFNVKRLAGATRYETNLKILEEAGAAGKAVLVCTGKDFADGLSASAVNLPILLVKDNLSSSQKAWLKSLGSTKFYIIGGKNAVNTKIETALKTYGETTRIEGATRYNTSVNIAKTFFPETYYAVLAYGENFPDGLSGGPLACSLGAPLILTRTGKQSVASAYTKGAGISYGVVLGGPKLVTNKVATAILSAK